MHRTQARCVAISRIARRHPFNGGRWRCTPLTTLGFITTASRTFLRNAEEGQEILLRPSLSYASSPVKIGTRQNYRSSVRYTGQFYPARADSLVVPQLPCFWRNMVVWQRPVNRHLHRDTTLCFIVLVFFNHISLEQAHYS